MAYIHDHLHDSTGLFRLPSGLPRWNAFGLFLMDIQIILAIIIGLGACLYVLKKFSKQFYNTDAEPICEGCEDDRRTGGRGKD